MNIVVVGYGEMLRALINGILASGHKIAGVFRHENVLLPHYKRVLNDKINPSSDFLFVKAHKLHDICADSVNSNKFINEVKNLNTDLIIVGSWSEKFSVQTLNAPKIACINVHPSLLPRYRGPNPYAQVLLNNETETGITFHIMDVNYDTGAIIHQKNVKILPSDNGISLKLRCCSTAEKEIQYLLKNFEFEFANAVSQDEKNSTYQHKILLKDCILNFKKETSEQISRKIRAFTPWAKCYIPYGNRFFSFNKFQILNKKEKNKAGKIVFIGKNSLCIVCSDDKVIKFSELNMVIPFSNLITKFYIKNFVKINSIAC